MKKQMKLFLLCCFFIAVNSYKLQAQNSPLETTDTSYTQSVTIADTVNAVPNEEVKSEKKYGATETIHYYSGKQPLINKKSAE